MSGSLNVSAVEDVGLAVETVVCQDASLVTLTLATTQEFQELKMNLKNESKCLTM